MPKEIDMSDRQVGCLKVVEKAGKDKYGQILWKCQCSCGNTTVVRGGDLRRGTTRSWGCINKKICRADK